MNFSLSTKQPERRKNFKSAKKYKIKSHSNKYSIVTYLVAVPRLCSEEIKHLQCSEWELVRFKKSFYCATSTIIRFIDRYNETIADKITVNSPEKVLGN